MTIMSYRRRLLDAVDITVNVPIHCLGIQSSYGESYVYSINSTSTHFIMLYLYNTYYYYSLTIMFSKFCCFKEKVEDIRKWCRLNTKGCLRKIH